MGSARIERTPQGRLRLSVAADSVRSVEKLKAAMSGNGWPARVEGGPWRLRDYLNGLNREIGG
jgi:hypothetical protein